MTMITPSYLGETIEYSSLHACRSTLEDPTTFLARIKPGMYADVFLLGYPNVRFRGRVEGVGWALFQENGASVEGLPLLAAASLAPGSSVT